MNRLQTLLLIVFFLWASLTLNAEILLYGSKQYDTETKLVTMEIKTGWNMVPWGTGYSQDNASCDFSHYGLLFFSPTVNNYGAVSVTGSTINYEVSGEQRIQMETALPVDREQKFRYISEETGAFMLYSFSDCVARTTLHKVFRSNQSPEQYDISLNRIRQGWNFLTITPLMTQSPANEWLGSCTITGINAWDASRQDWTDPANSPVLGGGTGNGEGMNLDVSQSIPRELIGLPYAFNFENDCQLNLG